MHDATNLSPSEFIQMKGRGTRRCDFSQAWITKSEIPDHIESQKGTVFTFRFLRNYEYFEKDFDYDEILELPAPSKPSEDPIQTDIDEAISTAPDPL